LSLAIPDDKAKCLLESARAETDTTTRNPLLLLRLSGVLLFRFAERQLVGLLFQLPPRKTRDVSALPLTKAHSNQILYEETQRVKA
jgi:hypothetical protein